MPGRERVRAIALSIAFLFAAVVLQLVRQPGAHTWDTVWAEDGRIYARGVGDDKGQIFIHLKAAEAWMASAGRLPVNLRIFFEGDEEVGSEPADTFIAEHPELLAADLCVVSDTGMQDDDGTPAITYGLRGIAYFEVRVSGP